MKSLNLYCVSIPLTPRTLRVAARNRQEAVELALASTGHPNVTCTEERSGPNWTFFKLKPGIPRTWKGENPVAPNLQNMGATITRLDVEDQGEVVLPEEITHDPG